MHVPLGALSVVTIENSIASLCPPTFVIRYVADACKGRNGACRSCIMIQASPSWRKLVTFVQLGEMVHLGEHEYGMSSLISFHWFSLQVIEWYL